MYTWAFHIFTDNMDEYTMEINKAMRTYRKFVQNSGKARLYLVVEDFEGETCLEDCLLSEGEYPL